MKIACISPDDLSTLIFCKTFSKIVHEEMSHQVDTISAVNLYQKEIDAMHSRHIEVPMERWISPHRDMLYLWRLFRILKNGQYDKVITFTTKPNIYGVIAAKLAGIPNITLAVRGLGQAFNLGEGLKHRLLHFAVQRLYKLSCRLADKVWFTNINDRKLFLDLGMVSKEKTFLTKNAVDLESFSMDAIAPDALDKLREELGIGSNNIVVMVARLIWSKGIREFISVATQLKNSHPHLQFLLIAPPEPGSAEAVPESFVRDAEQQANFRWLGFRKDVRELYALSDLSVLPSYYKEGGYPRALLEAMAFGKPVIAADTEDCKSPVEHGKNGYVVAPRNADALAQAIAQVFSSDEHREKLGVHSLQRIRKYFDDQIVVRQVLNNLN